MDIAMIGFWGWYGSMAEWNASAWIANGHKVTKYDRNALNDMKKDHQLYIFIDCSEDYSANIPNDIKVVKIFYSYDCHMPFGIERSTNIGRKCDLTFSMNYEHGKKLLDKFGINNIWMPSTYSDQLVFDSMLLRQYERDQGKENLEIDTCMIGNPNSEARLQLWQMLNDNYKSFTGKAETKTDYIKNMGGCKIVINQPTEPWDIITGIRFFEGLGFKKLLLQKRIKTKEIEKLGFEDGKHFIYWSDFVDLKRKIDYYLSHWEEVERIANNGYVRVQRMSMNAQAAKMEQIILDKFYDRL